MELTKLNQAERTFILRKGAENNWQLNFVSKER